MSRCLAPCAPAHPATGRCRGRWHGCGPAAKTGAPRGERWRRLRRYATWLLLLALPGGGLYLLFRWLYLRFSASD